MKRNNIMGKNSILALRRLAPLMQKKRWLYICLFLFFTFVINYCFPCLSVQAELASTPVAYTETGRVSFTDITGHWAEKEIRSWTARELAGGYPDGTFRPDSPITRAEFLALVNRAFGYAEMVGEKLNSSASSVNPVTFHDVAATDWYAVEFAQALSTKTRSRHGAKPPLPRP